MATDNVSVFLYVSAQFIGGFKKEIVLPFPFPPYVKAVCGTSGEGAISCIRCTCKKYLHAHVFFASTSFIKCSDTGRKSKFKYFFFFLRKINW